MITLEVKKLTKSYHYRKIFDGVNFKLGERESLVVTGKNGSGKTTLLRILTGLIRPTRGEVNISLDGKTVTEREKKKFLGYVAPDLNLYDELSAMENLVFLEKIQDLRYVKSDLKRKLEDVGLKDRGDELVSSYSSGMKQRLKYALAMLKEPRILILDEPASNLDQDGVFLLDRIIQRQKEKGILILATNDKKEEKYGSKILNLDESGSCGIS